jgi:dinuclear metal center YbgI/SA1388 family protein
MASRDAIIAFCDDLLEVSGFGDWCPNGLQVPGADEVGKVATAVSAHQASIEAAIECGAEMLITHHGLFWDFHERALTEAMASRLRTALIADLSVVGYHLPLDAHPGIGNNAVLCTELGLKPAPERIGEAKGSRVGVVGISDPPIPAAELFDRVRKVTDREPLVFDSGPAEVARVGIVSGAAASSIHEAIALDLDAFITGEPAEHVMADSTEGLLHFVAAGHYATEVGGIKSLGEVVAGEFGIETEFLDIPNPI